jgi:cytosine/adenosine deaminase-related metal-dependent hydrolase
MPTYLLQNALLWNWIPARLERADLRVSAGQIVAKAAALVPQPDEDIVDCAGKIIMPGMVCAHTHLYSTLACGMPGPAEPPANFLQILERVWWRLDRALDEESLYYSVLLGVLQALRSGTTTIIDHHASSGYIRGSLALIQRVFEDIGMRGVLCYEVTDRGGRTEREAGLA